MDKDEVDKILATSKPEDWVSDGEGKFTYKKDLQLHIEETSFENFRNFFEEWATKHPDTNAKAIDFTVKYGDSYVDEKMLVAVDGYRATLPLPKSTEELVVKKEDVNFAKIVDSGKRTEEYLKRSGICIEDDK